MRPTGNALFTILMGIGGAIAVWWFTWALQATTIFTGEPAPKGAAPPYILAWAITGIWIIVWTLIGLGTTLRDHGRWVITVNQFARAKIQDEQAERRAEEWREAQREKAFREQVEGVRARMAELAELQEKYGELGTIAFMLNRPIEDIQRVAGNDREN